MKKLTTILLVLIALSACGRKEEPVLVEARQRQFRALTNDEIIFETRKCESAGLTAQSLEETGFGPEIVQIQCRPRTP